MASTAIKKPKVVHSSFGRLRVHLPDPGETIVGRMRELPGVKFADRSLLTGNLLILYKPWQIYEERLLAELAPFSSSGNVEPPAKPLSVATPAHHDPNSSEIVIHQDDLTPTRRNVYVAGLRRHLYVTFGWASVGMAVVGAITPGIPTVPFVVLASYFFIRSSPVAHEWLLRSRWFGQILRDWEERRGVRPAVKYTALGLIVVSLVVTLVIGFPVIVIALILALEMIGLTIVWRLPVIESRPAPSIDAVVAL
jgi:uncharacterized membrane protein YbaN (DUF454 family)